MKHILLAGSLLALTACQSSYVDSNTPAQNTSTQTNASQSQQAQYATTVKYKQFSADVSSVSDGMGGYVLRIQPMGEKAIEKKIDAPVMKAEAADLNQDGYPEVVVFTQSVGSGSYGDVVAYSSNNGKSWTEASFPELSEKLSQGYMGHDSFAIKGNQLVREFKLYLDGDTNANPTGKTRQITYRLVDGEASRKFVVDRVAEL
ncbi:hypothetical protein [Psychrobacter sp. FDAARGOS_221]|uniref:hypothetical protein n=1 Tax=Psychrobacter sp. FDAARGOS_221 TaxID=1975705 RepID=UPI000BB5712D|nr:hypothetical protein [Psychrobacter sp. FDAARGOS_221]PNK60756.1 hypothetical protein A6J60_007620 [Psychrobacter sp. FDAARGOS_221]